MASEQLRREHLTADEQTIPVEKEQVTIMTTHFESVAEKVAGEDRNDSKAAQLDSEYEGKLERVGVAKIRASDDFNSIAGMEEVTDHEEITYAKAPSSEDNLNLGSTTTQQNSTDETIQTVQEKAKEMGATALEKAKVAKDYTVGKAIETKDVVAGYVAEKATAAKDTTLDNTKAVAEYVGQKVVAAKEVAVERGKETADYVGKVAVQVKDQAVGASWVTTQSTLQRLVDATKAAAGYTGDKAVGAKGNIDNMSMLRNENIRRFNEKEIKKE